MDKNERKKRFIRALAEYLAGDQVKHSIGLELGKPESQQWAKLRGETPLFGYATVEEAEATLTEFLS
jgi:hypothetical protein